MGIVAQSREMMTVDALRPPVKLFRGERLESLHELDLRDPATCRTRA